MFHKAMHLGVISWFLALVNISTESWLIPGFQCRELCSVFCRMLNTTERPHEAVDLSMAKCCGRKFDSVLDYSCMPVGAAGRLDTEFRASRMVA